jgi:hypothetical protein
MAKASDTQKAPRIGLSTWLLMGVIVGILLGFSLGRSSTRFEGSGFDKFLDWPFLLLVCTVFIVFVFQEELAGVLGRGDITLSWGERSIRLRDLSTNLDEELDPIRDDIEEIKKALPAFWSHATNRESKLRFQGFDQILVEDKTQNVPRSEATFVRQSLSEDQRQAALQKMKRALAETDFRWRSIERLAIAAGLPEDDALGILRSDPEVVLGKGKSGRRIARLVSR